MLIIQHECTTINGWEFVLFIATNESRCTSFHSFRAFSDLLQLCIFFLWNCYNYDNDFQNFHNHKNILITILLYYKNVESFNKRTINLGDFLAAIVRLHLNFIMICGHDHFFCGKVFGKFIMLTSCHIYNYFFCSIFTLFLYLKWFNILFVIWKYKMYIINVEHNSHKLYK